LRPEAPGEPYQRARPPARAQRGAWFGADPCELFLPELGVGLLDRGKATVKVRLGLDIKDPRILPEMGVRVNFLENVQKTATTQTGVLVPASAVVQRDGRNMVFEIAAGRARAVAVTLGATYGDMRVVDGIRQGVAIVKQPPAELNDGTKVELNGQAK